jgi:hypothetical protein
MRRLAFDRATLFKKGISDIPHRFRQQIAPLLFRPKQDEIDKAFAHLRY